MSYGPTTTDPLHLPSTGRASARHSVGSGVLQTGSFAAASRETGDVGDVPSSLWGLVVAIPTLALSWRRLHDTNRSGLRNGWIVLLVFHLSGPRPEGARFDR